MAFAVLLNLLCFCHYEKPETDRQYDETSRLIRAVIEEPVIHPDDDVYLQKRRMQERLHAIVRAKGAKMVNVASQLPFNLHNRELPVEKYQHSMSRSVSSSGDRSIDHSYESYHPSQNYYDVYSNRDSARRRKRHPFIPDDMVHGGPNYATSSSHSRNPEAGPSHGARTDSPVRDQPRPTPLLNVRLVGYTEKNSRGRARERNLSTPVPDPASPGTSEGTPMLDATNDAESDTSKSSTNDEPIIQFYDTGPLVVSWPDSE